MPDREKVIKGLEMCIRHGENPSVRCGQKDECPYEQNGLPCWIDLSRDALALLKEQDETIKELQNAYGYLQKQFFEAQDELLKEQEAVEQKTGHWIWLQFCANEGVYCSECHTKMFDYYSMKKKLSQFCGHCGAKMSDEVEGR